MSEISNNKREIFQNERERERERDKKIERQKVRRRKIETFLQTEK
jgi:hypothetical protein